jgi:hypothetical protein
MLWCSYRKITEAFMKLNVSKGKVELAVQAEQSTDGGGGGGDGGDGGGAVEWLLKHGGLQFVLFPQLPSLHVLLEVVCFLG